MWTADADQDVGKTDQRTLNVFLASEFWEHYGTTMECKRYLYPKWSVTREYPRANANDARNDVNNAINC